MIITEKLELTLVRLCCKQLSDKVIAILNEAGGNVWILVKDLLRS